jgi:hypothetical protein
MLAPTQSSIAANAELYAAERCPINSLPHFAGISLLKLHVAKLKFTSQGGLGLSENGQNLAAQPGFSFLLQLTPHKAARSVWSNKGDVEREARWPWWSMPQPFLTYIFLRKTERMGKAIISGPPKQLHPKKASPPSLVHIERSPAELAPLFLPEAEQGGFVGNENSAPHLC